MFHSIPHCTLIYVCMFSRSLGLSKRWNRVYDGRGHKHVYVTRNSHGRSRTNLVNVAPRWVVICLSFAEAASQRMGCCCGAPGGILQIEITKLGIICWGDIGRCGGNAGCQKSGDETTFSRLRTKHGVAEYFSGNFTNSAKVTFR